MTGGMKPLTQDFIAFNTLTLTCKKGWVILIYCFIFFPNSVHMLQDRTDDLVIKEMNLYTHHNLHTDIINNKYSTALDILSIHPPV